MNPWESSVWASLLLQLSISYMVKSRLFFSMGAGVAVEGAAGGGTTGGGVVGLGVWMQGGDTGVWVLTSMARGKARAPAVR